MLLLILCKVLNVESKIQLLQWLLRTCLKGGIPRNTKKKEKPSPSFLLEILCSTPEYSKYSDTSGKDISIGGKVKGILFLIFT